MSALLDQARKIAARETAAADAAKLAARDQVVAIASRELSDRLAKNDARDLVAALATAEMAEGDYEDLLDAIPRAARLEAEALHCKELAADAATARAELARVKAEAELAVHIATVRLRRANPSSRQVTIASAKRELALRFGFLYAADEPIEWLPGEVERVLDELRAADTATIARLEQEAKARIEGSIRRRSSQPTPSAAKPSRKAAAPKARAQAVDPLRDALPSIGD